MIDKICSNVGYEMDTTNNFIKICKYYTNACFRGKNMQNVRLKLSKDKTSFLTRGQLHYQFSIKICIL